MHSEITSTGTAAQSKEEVAPTRETAHGDSGLSHSRRAVLAAALGAGAATVVGGLTRPLPARADAGTFDTSMVDEDAVHATSNLGHGVYARSSGTDKFGVIGIANSNKTGVLGFSGSEGSQPASRDKTGVFGFADQDDNATGVYGESPNGIGVSGLGGTNAGVVGGSIAGVGIYGYSHHQHGIVGTTSAGFAGVMGQSSGDSTGVLGYSGDTGSEPGAPAKTGVYGFANQDAASIGVKGDSPLGRGGSFKGKAAQIRLAPATVTNHPASGLRGDLFVDKSGRLWYCKSGTTWKQLA